MIRFGFRGSAHSLCPEGVGGGGGSSSKLKGQQDELRTMKKRTAYVHKGLGRMYPDLLIF